MAKAALEKIETKILGIPEWCLTAFIQSPTVQEIEATIKHLVENPDVAKSVTVIEDSIFSLIVRGDDGVRHFLDTEIQFLATRQRDVVQRILSECKDLVSKLSVAISKVVVKKEVPPTGDTK